MNMIEISHNVIGKAFLKSSLEINLIILFDVNKIIVYTSNECRSNIESVVSLYLSMLISLSELLNFALIKVLLRVCL